MAHDLIRHRDRGRQIFIFREKEDICRFAADRFREISEKAIAKNGRSSIALSGGKTPVDAYAEIGRIGKGLDWKAVHIFQVDERVVPPDDSRNNFRMIKERLLDAVPIPVANVHPIITETDSHDSARRYEAELTRFFGMGNIPVFDFILLGVGEDGHTASLFPGLPALETEVRLVRAVEPGEGGLARVTLTLPVINHGRNAFFLITGEAKARIVRRVVDEQDPSLPASLVRPVEGTLFFLLDGEAGALLDTGEANITSHPS